MEEEEGTITRELPDEVQDWKLVSSIPKKGEKEQAPDGTTIQTDSLNESKKAMYSALEGVRGHHLKQLLVCVWVPWEKRSIVLHGKGNYFRDVGNPIGKNSVALSPLETLYLVERGTMVAYLLTEDRKSEFVGDFGLFDYAGLLPLDLAYLYALCFDDTGYSIDQYQIYSYLKRQGYLIRDFKNLKVEKEVEERSSMLKRMLQSLQVFGCRAMQNLQSFDFGVTKFLQSFGARLQVGVRRVNLVIRTYLQSFGVLSYPSNHQSHFSSKHYFNYTSIFQSLQLIPSYKKYDSLKNQPVASPHRITFNVWKPTPAFSKKLPPLPDFQICVVNTDQYDFPTLPQTQQLLNDINYSFEVPVVKVQETKPKPKNTPPSKKEIRMQRALERQSKLDLKVQQRNTYLKKRDEHFKLGTRKVVLGLVNSGVVNFVNLAEGGFAIGEDAGLSEIYERNHGIVYMENI